MFVTTLQMNMTDKKGIICLNVNGWHSSAMDPKMACTTSESIPIAPCTTTVCRVEETYNTICKIEFNAVYLRGRNARADRFSAQKQDRTTYTAWLLAECLSRVSNTRKLPSVCATQLRLMKHMTSRVFRSRRYRRRKERNFFSSAGLKS